MVEREGRTEFSELSRTATEADHRDRNGSLGHPTKRTGGVPYLILRSRSTHSTTAGTYCVGPRSRLSVDLSDSPGRTCWLGAVTGEILDSSHDSGARLDRSRETCRSRRALDPTKYVNTLVGTPYSLPSIVIDMITRGDRVLPGSLAYRPTDARVELPRSTPFALSSRFVVPPDRLPAPVDTGPDHVPVSRREQSFHRDQPIVCRRHSTTGTTNSWTHKQRS